MELSQRALETLAALFSPQSNLTLPVGLAEVVLEIRAWVAARNSATPKDHS